MDNLCVNDWISIASILIALIAFLYSWKSNTKKYELTYQYYNDILEWHNQVVSLLSTLRISSYKKEDKHQYLSQLYSLIECGRFYFPNIDKKDGFGKTKPIAYQGYRNVILDFLVYEYQIFEMEKCNEYLNHALYLQRMFTSFVFQYLDPKKQRRKIGKYTMVSNKEEFIFEEFLSIPSEKIFKQ